MLKNITNAFHQQFPSVDVWLDSRNCLMLYRTLGPKQPSKESHINSIDSKIHIL